MKTITKALVGAALSVAAASAVTFTPSTASAQEYYVNVVPPSYVASTEPVYWNGRPHYYYNGYWMYRDGPRWRYYQNEPTYFHDYRYRYPTGRWHYWRR